MTTLKLYRLQSGFYALDPLFLKTQETDPKTFRETLYDTGTEIQDDEHFYDTEVQQLFEEWANKNSRLDEFDFRELVLKTAYRVLGKDTLSIWLMAQFQGKPLSYLHSRFLVESILTATNSWQGFVTNKRSMAVGSYYRVLTASNAQKASSKDYHDALKAVEALAKDDNRLDMAQILACWTRSRAGMLDLLRTLHVIFGARNNLVFPALY